MAVDAASLPAASRRPHARRTLVAAGANHALHDGYTDLIYLLLPVWQAEFGLGYAALALLRTLYSGVLALLQMPATWLAQRFGARAILVAGTLLSAAGYALAGASGGLVGLCIALALGGAGSSTQHPLASALVSRAYGQAARGPLGTYNFAGDVGKAAVPLLVGLLVTAASWRFALGTVAVLGLAVAAATFLLLPGDRETGAVIAGRAAPAPAPQGRDRAALASRSSDDAAHASQSRDDPTHASRATGDTAGGAGGFRLLVAIGMLDNAARPAFLLYLPFLLQAKGAALATVGLALSLVFLGGALGKAACGWLGERFGVTRTVLLTETGTALAIVAVIVLPLTPALVLLPLLGVMLNGTSSVLYGTVPELAPHGQVERAFGIFYTCTLGGSALAAPLLYGPLGDAFGPSWAALASAATALAAVPLMLALSPSLPRRAG